MSSEPHSVYALPEVRLADIVVCEICDQPDSRGISGSLVALIFSPSMKILAVVLCAINYLQCFSEAARILAIIPFPARSHYSPFEPLFKKLSERGHEIKVVSQFPQNVEIPNFVDIDIKSSFSEMMGDNMPFPTAADDSTWKSAAKVLVEVAPHICDRVLGHPRVRKIIESDEKFDLILSELFITDCFLSLVHKFKVPFIGLTSSAAMPWLPEILANPDNPSYIPQVYCRSSDRMNYFERSVNAFQLLALKSAYKFYSDSLSHEIAKKYFGPDLPSFDDLRSKIGLVLINSHHAVTTSRALAPGVKEVGGIHIPSSGPPELPKVLKEYLDSATEGVVYFSMGSQLNSSTLPAKTMEIFLKTFAELPQRVLWKCNERNMPKLPKNVKCTGSSWVPQLSVLCHPNVRVFFGHGGLLGTQEAVYCGVPLLGMPLFGDQFLNIATSVERGFALKIDFYNPSYEEFSTNLKRLLTEPSFSARAKEASNRFRDRPQAPVDEAVFWVEYVLRHGPEALRTAASDLTWYQYLLLDVVAGIFIVLFIVFWSVRKFIRAILSGQKKDQVGIVKRKIN